MKLDLWINGMDSFLFGSICRSIRLNLSNRTGKDRLWIIRQSLHVPNQMHTLCIHYAYIKLIIFSHNPACFYVVAMCRRLNLRKWQVKKNNVAPCFNNIKYTCLRCQEYFCIPCSVWEWWNCQGLEGGHFSHTLWAMFLRSYGRERKGRR